MVCAEHLKNKMSPITISIVGILAIVSGIQAQNGGTCHFDIFQFTARHSLNMTQYMGDWYIQEIASSHIGNFPPPEYKCAKRSLRIPDSEDLLNLVEVDSFTDIASGISYLEEKFITVNATRSPLNSLWFMTSETGVTTKIVLLFADLDFSQWSVQYTCSIRGPENYRYETVQALTRSRTIEPELRQFLKALMVGQGFRIGDHHPVDQENCFN